jgi:predicted nucleic acid-binding protein
MQVFFDTSVLVAASETSHPHHTQAWPALHRVAAGEDVGFISVHSLAETYAALTRLPVRPRIHPSEAARLVTDNIVRHFQFTPAGQDEYLQALAWVRDGGLSGAKIYDALLLACAAQCPVQRIYTFNLSDFRLLAPTEPQAKICSP